MRDVAGNANTPSAMLGLHAACCGAARAAHLLLDRFVSLWKQIELSIAGSSAGQHVC